MGWFIPILRFLTLLVIPYPFQFDRDLIHFIHAGHLYYIWIAPFGREASSKLKHNNIGKEIMIEKTAHIAGVVATQFDLIPNFMAALQCPFTLLTVPTTRNPILSSPITAPFVICS